MLHRLSLSITIFTNCKHAHHTSHQSGYYTNRYLCNDHMAYVIAVTLYFTRTACRSEPAIHEDEQTFHSDHNNLATLSSHKAI
jgi:hypothetical protein